MEAEAALDEVRALARGVYPPLLAVRGLVDALRSVALRAPLSVHVIPDGVTRQPIEIESATYFTCVEAAQNALKHAHGATDVVIRLRQTNDRLHFDVGDNGPGFRPSVAVGRGLRNMYDRIEALGGHLAVEAELGHGTRVVGWVPLQSTAAPVGAAIE